MSSHMILDEEDRPTRVGIEQVAVGDHVSAHVQLQRHPTGNPRKGRPVSVRILCLIVGSGPIATGAALLSSLGHTSRPQHRQL